MPRIVYLSWPAREITGGIKMVFRHVEILREAGFEAIVATEDAQPPAWFETTAPVVGLDAVLADDVLVFPENHRGLLERFAERDGTVPRTLPVPPSEGSKKVVFCQNPYMISRGLGGKSDYSAYGVSCVLAVSPQTAEYCRNRFPSLPVVYLPVYVDRSLFQFQSQKVFQVAFAPRKRHLEAQCIFDQFRALCPEHRDVRWVKIDQLPERGVATVLKQSAVYLALCRLEAASLSILEAFACGCVVAGFTGIGGRLLANDSNGFWAAEDDCEGCAAQLAKAVRLVAEGGQPHADIVEAAVYTAGYYSRERLAKRLLEFWRRFVAV